MHCTWFPPGALHLGINQLTTTSDKHSIHQSSRSALHLSLMPGFLPKVVSTQPWFFNPAWCNNLPLHLYPDLPGITYIVYKVQCTSALWIFILLIPIPGRLTPPKCNAPSSILLIIAENLVNLSSRSAMHLSRLLVSQSQSAMHFCNMDIQTTYSIPGKFFAPKCNAPC